MSVAGVRSNRGDAYQVAVAMKEALYLIGREEGRCSLELDSTQLMADGSKISVDDIVVRYDDGSLVCIQCKKNQPNFEVWDVAGLADELIKTARLLLAEPTATVRFFSRADFGDLGRLVEFARVIGVGNEPAFEAGMAKNLRPSYEALGRLWNPLLSTSGSTAFELLLRVKFSITVEYEDVCSEVRLLLARLCTRADDAFTALWHALDNAGANLSSSATVAERSEFTSESLLALLHRMGCAWAPPKALADIQSLFRATSTVGRAWQRTVGGVQLDMAALTALKRMVDEKRNTVLLTDGPGAGKTCVLLSLFDWLETQPLVLPLFLQAREFAGASSAEAREALGLPRDVFALVSDASSQRHVVVVIDSLDVLSLARDTEDLRFFLALIDRLAAIPNVTVVAACRSFDLSYNRTLQSRTWPNRVAVGLLSWGGAVEPLLKSWNVVTDRLDEATRLLLQNPRNLSLFQAIVQRAGPNNLITAQQLTDTYLDYVVLRDSALGEEAMSGIEKMAALMLANRRLDIDARQLNVSEARVQALLSGNVLFSGRSGRYGFGHQTLLDALAVRGALRGGQSLLAFIQALPAVPFVRPTVRAFLSHLRSSDARSFRAQVRAVVDSKEAFHLKRLVVESLAEMEPEEEDWPLVRHLHREHEPLFDSFYWLANTRDWFELLHPRLVALWEAARNAERLQLHSGWVGRRNEPELDETVVDYWTRLVERDWIEEGLRRWTVVRAASQSEPSRLAKLLPLSRKLVELPGVKLDFVGRLLEKVVEVTGEGDEVLWRFITRDVVDDDYVRWHLDSQLSVEQKFENSDFLTSRMKASPWLLEKAIAELERWTRVGETPGAADDPPRWSGAFLEDTSYGESHSRVDLHHRSSLELLVGAVETAVIAHAEAGSRWWTEQAPRLCFSVCGGLRYIGMSALERFPSGSEELVGAVLSKPEIYLHTPAFELASFIRATAYYAPSVADEIERGIALSIDANWGRERRGQEAKLLLLTAVPASLRSQEAVIALDELSRSTRLPSNEPEIHRSGGWIRSPFSVQEFIDLSEGALLRLLKASLTLEWNRMDFGSLVGGLSEVVSTLRSWASKRPMLAIRLLKEQWANLDERYWEALLGGVSTYLQEERGNLQRNADQISIEHCDVDRLALEVLEELERHPLVWRWRLEGARAACGCAPVLALNDSQAERMVFWESGASLCRDPVFDGESERRGSSLGLNSVRGVLADTLMVIATKRLEAGLTLPDGLRSALSRMVLDEHPAVRDMVLRRLPWFISKDEQGWMLLEAGLAGGEMESWASAERCLYYLYFNHYSRVEPLLDQMLASHQPGALEAWGRITALSSLTGQTSFTHLSEGLRTLESEHAWKGATSVWCANARDSSYLAECVAGLELAVDSVNGAAHLAQGLSKLLKSDEVVQLVPMTLLRRILERTQELKQPGGFFGLEDWCVAVADIDPPYGLDAAEAIVACTSLAPVGNDADAWPRLLTTLFREAEEAEPSDGGAMLARVIALQDGILKAAPDAIHSWLRAAEREEA